MTSATQRDLDEAELLVAAIDLLVDETSNIPDPLDDLPEYVGTEHVHCSIVVHPVNVDEVRMLIASARTFEDEEYEEAVYIEGPERIVHGVVDQLFTRYGPRLDFPSKHHNHVYTARRTD